MKRQQKLSLSEKGKKGARAQQAARREQRETEEVQAKAKASMRRRPGTLADVPPWCHLSGNRSPAEAAAEAVKAHKASSATDALVLLWNLRRVAAADAELLAAAETHSAEIWSESPANTEQNGFDQDITLVSTHKDGRGTELVTVKLSYVRNLRKQCERFRLRAGEAERTRAETDRRLIRAEITVAAMRAGMVDPDAWVFLDLSEVTLDSKGNLLGAKEAIDTLKRQKPHIFKTGAHKHLSQPPAATAPGTFDEVLP
ncbi:MAG: hypothetical protein EKK46_15130 [Rhodocyclaceae bacterium]|nr:MAG: hypothetical protein EKK46_15130 [Rhodocyclaceae bacterium]